MTNILKKYNWTFSRITGMFYTLNFFGIKKSSLFFPVFLFILIAVLEGVSIFLLIPTIRGLLLADFSFVSNIPLMRNLFAYLPENWSTANLGVFTILLLIIFSAIIIKSLLNYVVSTHYSYQSRMLRHNMRKMVFEKILSFGKLYFDRSSTGYITSLISSYPVQISANFKTMMLQFSWGLVIIVYLIIMAFISWQLTLILCFLYPVSMKLYSYLGSVIASKSDSLSKQEKKVSENEFNVISNIPLVKFYGTEQKTVEHYEKLSLSSTKTLFQMDKISSLIHPLQEILVVLLVIIFAGIVSATLLKRDYGKLSEYLVYFYLIRRSSAILTGLGRVKTTLAENSGILQNIMDVFTYDDDKHTVKSGNKIFPGINSDIELVNLKFSYIEGVPVLKNISAVINRNTITAFIGPTGSGKTTLINLILRFYDCPDESIKINGESIRNFSPESLRKRMAYVSQHSLLFNDSIKNNITYGINDYSKEDLAVVIKKARLESFVNSLPQGIDTNIGDYGIKLSGGEKQRVAIARALLKKAEILILDEATNSLDITTEKLIQEAIDELVKGKTTIVIAHRLSTIKNADKVIVIKNGYIIEQGNFNELLSRKGYFYNYWDEHTKIESNIYKTLKFSES